MTDAPLRVSLIYRDGLKLQPLPYLKKLPDSAGYDLQREVPQFVVGRSQEPSIDGEKDHCGRERHPLIAVDEWVVKRDRSQQDSGFVENRRVRGLAESGLSGQFEDPLQNVRAETTAEHLKRRHSLGLTGHTFGQLER